MGTYVCVHACANPITLWKARFNHNGLDDLGVGFLYYTWDGNCLPPQNLYTLTHQAALIAAEA